jgi:hypothetical protein
MKDLPRLAGSSPNAMTRALLEAGREDAPSEDARTRAAIAIGVAATITATATATAGTSAGAASGGAAVSKWLASLGILKVAGATVVAGAVVVSASAPLQRALFEPSPPATAQVAAPAAVKSRPARPTAPARRPSPTTEEPESAPVEAVGLVPSDVPAAPAPQETPQVVSPTVRAQEALASPAPKPLPAPQAELARRAPPQPSVDADGLRAEVSALDHARAAIGADAGRRALLQLDDYERAFPSGTLRDEARVLRIEALAASGEIERAKSVADALLASDPDSPHARRVRSLLASLTADAGAP